MLPRVAGVGVADWLRKRADASCGQHSQRDASISRWLQAHSLEHPIALLFSLHIACWSASRMRGCSCVTEARLRSLAAAALVLLTAARLSCPRVHSLVCPSLPSAAPLALCCCFVLLSSANLKRATADGGKSEAQQQQRREERRETKGRARSRRRRSAPLAHRSCGRARCSPPEPLACPRCTQLAAAPFHLACPFGLPLLPLALFLSRGSFLQLPPPPRLDPRQSQVHWKARDVRSNKKQTKGGRRRDERDTRSTDPLSRVGRAQYRGKRGRLKINKAAASFQSKHHEQRSSCRLSGGAS